MDRTQNGICFADAMHAAICADGRALVTVNCCPELDRNAGNYSFLASIVVDKGTEPLEVIIRGRESGNGTYAVVHVVQTAGGSAARFHVAGVLAMDPKLWVG
jgi:hypothetical protein